MKTKLLKKLRKKAERNVYADKGVFVVGSKEVKTGYIVCHNRGWFTDCAKTPVTREEALNRLKKLRAQYILLYVLNKKIRKAKRL